MRIKPNNVYFILVEPKTPGNIGAAARALKTMGFKNLVLINPGEFNTPEARWMAHASEDILESAIVYPTLEEAISEMNFVAATTQRPRSSHLPFFTPPEFCKKVIPITLDHKVAIVFGRETSGLSNSELAMCDAVTTVPAHTRHPSLNLAQTVMIYAYELFQATYGDLKSFNYKLAKHKDLESLYQHMQKSLKRIGFIPIDSWENFTLRFSRLLGRANTEVRDVRVWHKIFKSFDEYIDQLEQKVNEGKEENS
jgi:TrmH family RNA methyltransferase